MADTISEQIVQAIVTALSAIQRPTYSLSVEVKRVKVFGNSTVNPNKDAVIQVVSRPPKRNRSQGYAGRAYYEMLVGVFTTLKVSSNDTDPPDGLQAAMLADIEKVVEANLQWGGLASLTETEDPEFGYDQGLPGADVLLRVKFFTSRTNPYSLS